MKLLNKRLVSFLLAVVMLLGMMPMTAFTANEETGVSAQDSFAGKTVSILSHSMSTYAGVSNSTAANSTIGNNDVYYTEGRLGVYQKDTWWQQVIDALDMELLVNNSWSGSCVFMPRKGEASVGYGDRAVNLHNDHTGEEPDIIFIYLGCNDFAYYQDTFGKAADVDYLTLIQENSDGSFSYTAPKTTCEAYAIMLHKVTNRYPEAEIYCMTSTARRDPDYTGDSYPDAGQPTAFSAELIKVAQHFSFPVINLENAIPKEAETFDKYIGDMRAHANALGMDQIANEVLSVMLDKDAEVRHVTSGDGTVAEQAVLLGGSYYADIELPEGYSAVVTMNGVDITTEVCNDGKISIEEVTGDIAIHAIITRNPWSFRWEVRDGLLTSVGSAENVLNKLSGTVTNGILNDGIFQLNTPVVLKCNRPWTVEWKCAGDWRGAVLTSDTNAAIKGMTYLSRVNGGQLCFGTYTGSQYDNYGIDISYLNSDTHTYRLENRIAADGSNMIWLYVDGEEIGPMNNYFIGSKAQNKTADWVSGKDFVFSCIGITGHALRNCQLDYLTVTECVHTYENGTCTACGAEHPNLANYEGKVISILGGSTCTFDGYIPVADGFNLTHRPRYPQSNLLTDVNDTWWMQLVAELDAKLGINDSWAGSQVLNTLDSNSGDLGPDAAMASLTRIQNLGANGTPDIVLFYGAMNDIGRAVTLGSFDAATAPTQVDLAATKWDNLADAYVAAIMRMQHYYPDTQIVAMLPGPTASYYTESERQAYCEVLKAICDHYGVPTVDLSTCGLTTADMPDGTHPNAVGMDYITAAVLETLLSECEMENGENMAHSVTHELSGAESSLGYYKGVSNGKSFATTITGENVTVTVTMDGVDITDQVYMDGKIMISAVTGDVVITAKGIYNADGRLQQLPDNYCCNTNLWTLLDPVNEYYTTSGWGNNSNSNYSVTFPVAVGDRIWATSFGAAGTNGYTANAVRITWFGEDGVLKSLGRDVVYAEFAEYGYITVPEGAVAVNIPMVSNANTWEIYILNRDHCYESGTCTGCGEAQPGPVITQQPTNGEAKLGEHYMVEVKAEGEGLKYQWYFRNAGSSKWNKSSVKDNTYDDVMTTARAGREVYCVITDANGNSVKTDTVKLVLLPSEELEITQQPTDDQVYFGEHFCATVEAKGEKLKYQWYFRNAGSDKWYKSSVKDNTYDDVMTKARAGREIYCVITDAYGNSVTTETVKLICIPTELEIISQPTSAEVSFGEMFCATVEAKGDGLKYQWYFRNSGTDKWYKSGVRDNTYDDVMTKARNHREIYCVITDMWGNSVTTDTVKLTAVPSVELKVLSQSYESAVMGERYCVTVEAQGDGLNYQWYFRNAGASRWSKSGVRDNTYDDVMNKTRANREVYCVISDACGNQITTEVITLTVEQ